jgi:hypothetical protein
MTSANSISYIGKSNKKKDSLLLSMKLHMQYLRSLEDSQRVRNACLAYMQTKFYIFYPERPDLVAELQELVAQLGDHLEAPRLRWKYAWMAPIFGLTAAKWAQRAFPQMKASCLRHFDKAIFDLEEGQAAASLRPRAARAN